MAEQFGKHTHIKLISFITIVYFTGQMTSSDTSVTDTSTSNMNEIHISSYENVSVNFSVEVSAGKPQWQDWLDFSQIAISAVGK